MEEPVGNRQRDNIRDILQAFAFIGHDNEPLILLIDHHYATIIHSIASKIQPFNKEQNP